MISRLKITAAAAALAVGLGFGATSAQAEAPESTDPIKIALFDWTSVNLNAHILGDILTKLGYNVEYVTADYLSSLTTGLTNGDLTVAMEHWDTTAGEAMAASEATGQTERLGKLGPQAKEEWWYPLYMKEKCPGLPNWEALKDPKCAEAFSTPETAPNGRYLGGPVTWGGFDEERVEALELPFQVVHAGTDAALFAELESAYQRQAPFIGWIYTPHWAPIKYEGAWVEFPEYEDACYVDAAWGLNPDATHDCGKPHGWIKKVGWAGGEAKWPAAYAAIRNFKIDNKTMGELIAKVDLEGHKVEDVVAGWMKDNEATWKAWIGG